MNASSKSQTEINTQQLNTQDSPLLDYYCLSARGDFLLLYLLQNCIMERYWACFPAPHLMTFHKQFKAGHGETVYSEKNGKYFKSGIDLLFCCLSRYEKMITVR